jgi:hypothetical protein
MCFVLKQDRDGQNANDIYTAQRLRLDTISDIYYSCLSLEELIGANRNSPLVVTGWGYGLWAIAEMITNSYISFYAAMGGAMGGFVRWL